MARRARLESGARPTAEKESELPDGGLASAYEALGRGDSGPLLGLLEPGFEWIEPEVPGYPLSGIHHGAEGLGGVLDRLQVMFEDLAIGADEVLESGDRVVAVGKLHGRPPGAGSDWVLPFAHVWAVSYTHLTLPTICSV